ncbi:hypothetical protein AAC978_07655 [Desulfitobacterium sp. THU1]|uniref:hypothetical protein n=1 Tax=Desulfitobacterium sp. THU1 TaxID=3138072 RepID=UPI00311F3B1C
MKISIPFLGFDAPTIDQKSMQKSAVIIPVPVERQEIQTMQQKIEACPIIDGLWDRPCKSDCSSTYEITIKTTNSALHRKF